MNVFSKNSHICGTIAQSLVMNGANVNLKDGENWTPLHIAVRKN
jgi:ankyrin repeat protein